MTSDITPKHEPRTTTTVEALYEIADQHPQDIAVIFSRGRRPYGELLNGLSWRWQFHARRGVHHSHRK